MSEQRVASRKQIVLGTFVALLTAAGLLVFVVLPAEYGIDVTGLGAALGLTELASVRPGVVALQTREHKTDSAEFVLDRVEVARQWWIENFPGKAHFSSKASDIVPSNAPSRGATCMRYSVVAKTEKEIQRVEGLACAWPVDKPKAGQWTIESFWLEANDTYGPSQQPMASFDAVVRDLLLSARLTPSQQQ